MKTQKREGRTTVSVVVPCFNEEKTLKKCVERVLAIADSSLSPEIIIVDDCSADQSLAIAKSLQAGHSEIKVLSHDKNQGKGAALRTGFKEASGDFIAVQDADLEYDPSDLKKLLDPLISGDADVVFGSRFLSNGSHQVVSFWHYMGNRFLTFMSNMFTDLNLTDMETCYKVFRRDIIQQIEIEENRFGFEPEIVAKLSQQGIRIFEMGISYCGRTYADGKKIGVKDGFRALYSIFRYNAPSAPIPARLMLYFFTGGVSAVLNLLVFLGMFYNGGGIEGSALTAFSIAAIVNYFLCTLILLRRKYRNRIRETACYILVAGLAAVLDLWITKFLFVSGAGPFLSKIGAGSLSLTFNFITIYFFVCSEPASSTWRVPEVLHGKADEV
jgi:glycosyltransferase involved in cell wall biosynthesis